MKSDGLEYPKSEEPSKISTETEDEADRSFPSGWYLMPGLILSFVLWGFAIYGIVRFLRP